MKVNNTSRHVIKLLKGKEKVVLLPGTNDVYEVTDCPDVQYLIDKGDLAEAVVRSKSKPTDNSKKGVDSESESKDKK